jgi:hypothetical protein
MGQHPARLGEPRGLDGRAADVDRDDRRIVHRGRLLVVDRACRTMDDQSV